MLRPNLSCERRTKIIHLPVRGQYPIRNHEICVSFDSVIRIQRRQHRFQKLFLPCHIAVSLKLRDPNVAALGGEDEIGDVAVEGVDVVLDAAGAAGAAVPVAADEVTGKGSVSVSLWYGMHT